MIAKRLDSVTIATRRVPFRTSSDISSGLRMQMRLQSTVHSNRPLKSAYTLTLTSGPPETGCLGRAVLSHCAARPHDHTLKMKDLTWTTMQR